MISLVRGEREGEAMNPHQGHRERRKRQFRDFGLDAFADHEALELLLFFAIPRQDTNPLAHELLSRFGSLEAVLEASVEELTAVPGIGENAALLLEQHYVLLALNLAVSLLGGLLAARAGLRCAQALCARAREELR